MPGGGPYEVHAKEGSRGPGQFRERTPACEQGGGSCRPGCMRGQQYMSSLGTRYLSNSGGGLSRQVKWVRPEAGGQVNVAGWDLGPERGSA